MKDHCCVRCPSYVYYSTAFLKLGRIEFSADSGGKGSWSVGPVERADCSRAC